MFSLEYLNSTPPPCSGVEENVYGGGVEKDYRNLDILIAMNFRKTISLEIPFELLIRSNIIVFSFITF